VKELEDLEREAFVQEADALSRLAQTLEWPVYERLLSDMRLSALEALAAAPQEDVRFWQGAVQMLAIILERPKQITETAAALIEEEESEADRFKDSRRSLDLMGGPLTDDI
jgi:hypothetical protein